MQLQHRVLHHSTASLAPHARLYARPPPPPPPLTGADQRGARYAAAGARAQLGHVTRHGVGAEWATSSESREEGRRVVTVHRRAAGVDAIRQHAPDEPPHGRGITTFGSRMVGVRDSGAEGPGFKSQRNPVG